MSRRSWGRENVCSSHQFKKNSYKDVNSSAVMSFKPCYLNRISLALSPSVEGERNKQEGQEVCVCVCVCVYRMGWRGSSSLTIHTI